MQLGAVQPTIHTPQFLFADMERFRNHGSPAEQADKTVPGLPFRSGEIMGPRVGHIGIIGEKDLIGRGGGADGRDAA